MVEDNFIIKRIKEICEEKKWSIYRLAKESGIPNTTLANMMKKNTMPTFPTLLRICSGFGITLSQFFQDDQSRTVVDLTDDQMHLLELYLSYSLEKKDFCLRIMEYLKRL